MQKKILILNFILLCFLLYFLFNKKPITNEIKIKSDPVWVENFNSRNKKINKIYANIVVKCNNLSNYGTICYEKKQNFRMILNFAFFKNLDIGSNQNFIWFWSKNIKPKALYFCSYEDLHKTRLKKIFHPNIIKKILGIETLQNYQIKINEFDIEVIENLENELTKKTILNQNGIKEIFIYEKGIEILRVKNIEFEKIQEFIIPKTIQVYWIQENVKSEWRLENIQLNNNYQDFTMPDYRPKINISNY